ncbi:ribosomal protein L4/L1 family-domain-containing protein [Glomus cerebriforme]|uniref:Large ribosomal subunit protein uL4m n=1 Tax=Glomus cerebriforme TaxID=658196 RepID=A0A397T9R6_9GLOM|nr:ribosomal protein L4/L1 family-domain-containing protein [Glomus cerebriforme]
MWAKEWRTLLLKQWQNQRRLHTKFIPEKILTKENSTQPKVVLKAVSPLPTNIQAWIHDFETNTPLGIINLDRKVFAAPIRKDLLQRAIVWQRDCLRQGTHSSKNRSEVRGTTRKWAPQKGRGKARVGSHRAPQFRGGGVAHGPKPRSHASDLPRQVQLFGLRSALATKFAQNQLFIVENLKLKTSKTRDLLSILNRNAWDPLADDRKQGHSILFLTMDHIKELDLASRNLQRVHVLTANEIVETGDVYNIMGHEILMIDHKTVGLLEELLRPK